MHQVVSKQAPGKVGPGFAQHLQALKVEGQEGAWVLSGCCGPEQSRAPPAAHIAPGRHVPVTVTLIHSASAASCTTKSRAEHTKSRPKPVPKAGGGMQQTEPGVGTGPCGGSALGTKEHHCYHGQ